MFDVFAVLKQGQEETLYRLGQVNSASIPKSEDVEAVVVNNSDEVNRMLAGTPPTQLVGYRVLDKEGNNVSAAVARQEWEGGRYVERSMQDGF